MTFEQYKERYTLTGLTTQQEEAIKRTEGQTLLLAVPGSGKTTVTVARLGYMAKCLGLDASSFLTLTYSVSACKDMKDRYTYYFGAEKVPKFRTIHGICALIIRYFEKARGLRALNLVDTDGEASAIIEKIYSETFGKTPSPNDVCEIKARITYARNMMLTQREITALEFGEKLWQIMLAYSQYKEKNGIMDYDDQLSRAYEILSGSPDVLSYFSDKFRYVSVDEAQDTSKLQHEIIRLLCQKHKNIFMVGDEDQSIYGFRAAYPRALLDFDKVYPEGKILYMEENFRSTGEIVKCAKQLISNNKQRRKKNMTTAKVRGEKIKTVKLPDYENRAEYLLGICESSMHEKETTAILFRNNASALPLVDLLARKDIPYKYRENDGLFFSGTAVSDMLLALEFCENTGSEELFIKICSRLGCAVSQSCARIIVQKCNKESVDYLDGLCREVSHQKQIYRKATALCTAIRHLKGKSAVYCIKTLYNDTCFGERLRRQSKNGNSISVLMALARQYRDIPDFLCGMRRLSERIKNYCEPEEKCIVLSTIHSSKGLEYDNVIIIDTEDKVLAENSLNHSVSNTLEEERRLFYVALTRARKNVSFVFCKKEFGTPLRKGRFIREATALSNFFR